VNRYIYTGVLSVESNEINLMDVIVAADELQLLKVYQKLENQLLENNLAWKPKDIITALQYDRFTNLYNFALGLTFRNPKVIFESEDFPKIKEPQLIQLLKFDDIELKEIEIWEYLIKWGTQNTYSILDEDKIYKWTPENFVDLKNTIRNCIPHIRFFNMSPNEYTKATYCFKDILPDGLDEKVLRYFSDPTNTNLSFDVLPLRGYPFDSKIINAKDAALIASWINKKQKPYLYNNLPFKFKLIYRASRDGFGINNFHNHCDNIGSTIVVIKARNTGEIIGGYNPLEWRSVKVEENETSALLSHNQDFYNGYKCRASNSFIFSLTNQKIPILSRVSSKKEAIIWYRNRGPCFGLQDLCIKPSEPYVVCESKQYSYENKIIDREIFEIEEYEVFQVDKGFSQRIMSLIMKIIIITKMFVFNMCFGIFCHLLIGLLYLLVFIFSLIIIIDVIDPRSFFELFGCLFVWYFIAMLSSILYYYIFSYYEEFVKYLRFKFFGDEV
jgi:hypothetical protein